MEILGQPREHTSPQGGVLVRQRREGLLEQLAIGIVDDVGLEIALAEPERGECELLRRDLAPVAPRRGEEGLACSVLSCLPLNAAEGQQQVAVRR